MSVELSTIKLLINLINLINLANLLHQRTIESERVEYKAGWKPESVIHTLSAFANDFHNFCAVMRCLAKLKKIAVKLHT